MLTRLLKMTLGKAIRHPAGTREVRGRGVPGCGGQAWRRPVLGTCSPAPGSLSAPCTPGLAVTSAPQIPSSTVPALSQVSGPAEASDFPPGAPWCPASLGRVPSLYWETSELPGPHGPMSKRARLHFLLCRPCRFILFSVTVPLPIPPPHPPIHSLLSPLPVFCGQGSCFCSKDERHVGPGQSPRPSPCFVRVVLSTRELSPKSCTKWLI